MSETLRTAIKAVEKVYNEFLEEVVEKYVLKERVGSLGERERKEINKGKSQNILPVNLMSISGKGGWSDDPELAERYAKNTNVSLLDHLLSVTRGAMTLAAYHWNHQKWCLIN